MAARKRLISKSRRLSAQKARRVARSLQRAAAVSVSRTTFMRPLSLKSTATGGGSVVFRASRVLGSFARAAKS